MAQNNFKQCFLRVRGSKSFPLSRMHLNGFCRGGLVISHLKDSDDREEKQKEKTNRPLQFPWVDFLRDESFWSLSYPVLLQPESQVSLVQDADPQAGWGVTASWRLNPQAGQGMSTFWDSWTGVGYPQGLHCDQCWVGLRGCNFNSLPVHHRWE